MALYVLWLNVMVKQHSPWLQVLVWVVSFTVTVLFFSGLISRVSVVLKFIIGIAIGLLSSLVALIFIVSTSYGEEQFVARYVASVWSYPLVSMGWLCGGLLLVTLPRRTSC